MAKGKSELTKENVISGLRSMMIMVKKHDTMTITCDGNLYELIREAHRMLKRMEAVEPELEGGTSSYWYVCGACHGIVDVKDAYCKHCGTKIKWNK